MSVPPSLLERRERLDAALGGPARRRVVVLLACVLALDAADKSTLGAVAAELQTGLGVTNLELGVLAAASLGVAGLATVPIGVLTDRVRRTALIGTSIALWGASLLVAGASSSFEMLLLSRLGLGAVSATAGPTLSSLIGDYFPARDRGRIYGYILTGEIVGAGVGFVLAGEVAAVLGWRWGFWILVVAAAGLALAVFRLLPEPARGGASRIPEGAYTVPETNETRAPSNSSRPVGSDERTLAQEVAGDQEIEPVEERVLDEDPASMGLPDAVRYVLRVPTNRILIIASALGWFFFAGVRTFGVIFLRGQYGVGQATATALLGVIGLGALLGVLIGGRASDALIERGRLNGRVLVAFTGYALTPVLLAPGIVSDTLLISMPLFLAGSMALAMANPPVDAGRLDVMHHRLWGRAEGVRTLTRTWAEGSAPIVFGLISQLLGQASAGSPFAGEEAARSGATHAAQGIRYALLIMLGPVIAGALIGLRALRSYPTDVATAGESEERTSEAPAAVDR